MNTCTKDLSAIPPDFHVTILNNWSVPPEYRKYLTHYYLLHWETEYLLTKIGNRSDRLIEHNSVLYVPVYKSPIVLDRSAQIMLSFRSSQDFNLNLNYVLIKSPT